MSFELEEQYKMIRDVAAQFAKSEISKEESKRVKKE